MYKKPEVKMSYNIGNMDNGDVLLTDAWRHSTTSPWANHYSRTWNDVLNALWVLGWVAYA